MNTTAYKNPNTQYVPYSKITKCGFAAIALPLMLLTSGSGGTISARSATEQSRWVYSPNIQVERRAIHKFDTRSPAEHVAFIRNALGLNMSELAIVLGVTRPTVYAWLEGQEPKPEAILQIRHLSKVAVELQDLKIPRIDKLIRRPMLGGGSLLEDLKANIDPSESIAMLKAYADKQMKARIAPKGSGRHKRSLDDVAAEYSVSSYSRNEIS